MTTRGIVLVFGDVVVELLPGMSEWLVGSGCHYGVPVAPAFQVLLQLLSSFHVVFVARASFFVF